MNKVTLVGNVVNDLELKDYKKDEKEGKYVRFTLAVNEYNVKRNERIATFVEVVAFDKKAIILAHNVGKGSRLAVEGKIRSSNYTPIYTLSNSMKSCHANTSRKIDFHILSRIDATL